MTGNTASPLPHEVPDFTEECYAPRRAEYCICVFVINEGERLLGQLERMRPHVDGVDVIVADGGSTDGSTARSELEARGVNTLLVKRGPGRLGAQMRMAFAWALRRGYAGVVVMDGNGKDGPEAIPDMVDALRAGVQHVQGSRYIAGGKGVNTPLSRSIGVRILHAPLVSLAAGHRYTDTTNGFRAYAREFLEDPRVAPLRDVFTGYELHYYLAIRAGQLGASIREVPVTRTYPARGKTPTKISPVRGNVGVLRALFRACLHRFDPAPRGDQT